MIQKSELVHLMKNALNALEENQTKNEIIRELKCENRKLKKELEYEKLRNKELEIALDAPPYPECRAFFDDGDGYPPNVICKKWNIWIDDEWSDLCEKCRGRFRKEQINDQRR